MLKRVFSDFSINDVKMRSGGLFWGKPGERRFWHCLRKPRKNAVGNAFLAKTYFSIIFAVVGALGCQKAAFYACLAGRRARLRATLHAFLRGFLDFTTFAKRPPRFVSFFFAFSIWKRVEKAKQLIQKIQIQKILRNFPKLCKVNFQSTFVLGGNVPYLILTFLIKKLHIPKSF